MSLVVIGFEAMPASCLLYYVTDRSAFSGDESARRKQLLAKITEAASAGIDYIQLREKDLLVRDLQSLAADAVRVLTQLRNENPELRAKLLINSRTDVALASGADGVHLRSEDISPLEVRDIWKKSGENRRREPLIGVSCHSREEVNRAEANGADFTVFGPIFEKQGASPAGLDALREACRAKIPVLALGGVTLDNAQSCLEAGAAGMAAIRLFQENKIANVVRKLHQNS